MAEQKTGWLHYVLIGALVMVPIAAALKYWFAAPPLAVFAAGGVAIAVLAEWMRRATEQVAVHAGPSIGGLLNVSFGSASELILALFVIAAGHVEVVRAQITGSIIGTSLLGLGLSCLVGGLGRQRQTFSRDRAGLQSSLLSIVVVALLLPAIFDRADASVSADAASRALSEEWLSICAAVVLLLLYAGNLVFTLVTHRNVFARTDAEGEGEANAAGEEARWSLTRALIVLVAATAAVAGCAEMVSDALQEAAEALGLPLVFVGVIPLALIGTAADLFAAVGFARQDRMSLVMSICVGSAIQVGLVVAPLLVLISWLMGNPLSLVFPSLLDLFAIVSAAYLTKSIAADGESNWYEGLMLIGVYLLLAIAFFFLSPG